MARVARAKEKAGEAREGCVFVEPTGVWKRVEILAFVQAATVPQTSLTLDQATQGSFDRPTKML
jgi:hypothetical protein